MYLSEIRDAVSGLVTDSGYTATVIDSYVNEVVQEIAGKYEIPGRKSFASVTTSAEEAYVSLGNLTQGFSGKLLRARQVGQSVNLTIFNSLEALFDVYTLDEVGDIEAVALEGTTLWYQKIPIDPVTVSVLYLANPPLLSTDDDSPDFVPAFLHRRLFVNGTAAKILDEIEESIEGKKSARNAQLDLYGEGITDMLHWIARNKKHTVAAWSD